MIAVMVARLDFGVYAGHLVWVPLTLFVAMVLGVVAYTVNAMIWLFKEEE